MADDDMVDIPFEVFPLEHGSRADVFLSRRIKRMTRSKAARIIREGSVRLEDAEGERVAKPSSRVQSGERLLLKRRKLEEAPIDDIELPVLYEDDDLLAVNKPGNLVVHPTASAYNRTLIRVLRVRHPDLYLSLAHRIDKETSGLILVAKNRDAERELKTDFAERRVDKTYLAIVNGVFEADRQVVDAPMRLKPDSDSGVIMEIGGDGAAAAVTEVRTRARSGTHSLVEAKPRTGRQHQIRLHLAHLGHPIVGDKLYLRGEQTFLECLREGLDADRVSDLLGHHRHALHAHRIRFTHPSSGEEMTLEAPLTGDLLALAERLELDHEGEPAGKDGD